MPQELTIKLTAEGVNEMKVSMITRRGIGSEASQDRVLIGGHVLCDEEFFEEFDKPCAVGIADGVGGNAGGDVAAEFVCRGLSSLSVFTPQEALRVNSELLEYAGAIPGMENMASTFSGIFPGGKLFHIGNTRICAVQGGYLKQLTVDMTTRNYLASLGRSEEAEHCNSNEITACFGGGRESFYAPVIFEIPLTGALLMTSDGVHDHVTTDDLESIISNAGSDPDVLRGMISRALECGSEDDLSAILLKF